VSLARAQAEAGAAVGLMDLLSKQLALPPFTQPDAWSPPGSLAALQASGLLPYFLPSLRSS